MATKSKNRRNLLLNFLSWAFKRYRGASKDGGGTRELSSGFISDRIIDKLIFETVKYRGSLLEIGCGEGLFLKKMIHSGSNKLFGVDLSFQMLSRTYSVLGEDRKKVHFVQAGGQAMPFQDGVFGRAVCVNILHNLPTKELLEEIIAEAGRVLEKNGVCIFDIRNRYNPIMYMLYRWAVLYDTTVRHLPLNTYFYHDINRMLKKHHLSVVAKKGIYIPLWFLAPVYVIVARKD